MTKTRVAAIGAGSWGRNHVRNLANLPEAELVAVCDLSEDRRNAVKRQYPGVHVTADHSEALDMAEAAVIATPATSHAELALAAIERNLPVLVEKPFALSVREAESIADASEAKGVPVVTGHLLLFHSAIERLGQLIDEGELGDLYYLYSQRVNLGQVRPDENALWSFGPHDVAVALELLGDAPISVAAQGKSYLQPGIEDVVFMNMEFASGIMAHVQMSWLDPHKERRLTVVGSEKMVVFDDMQSREKLKIYDKGVDRPPDYASYGESLSIREGDIAIPRIPNAEPLAAELRHFIAVANGTATSRTPASNGVEVVRVLEGASRSLAAGGTAVNLVSS
ncbi:MAG: Gfo/Idh/MocA family oxidoreductase [Gemmatimonadota bacterium]|nr:MAG: Gfo/Idh/MocA family oxidoreductase [Gemmatimonadota bacterium]